MRFSSFAFGLPYLLIELFSIGVPVVRTDGRSVGRSGGVRSRDYQIQSRMGRFTQPWGSASARFKRLELCYYYWDYLLLLDT